VNLHFGRAGFGRHPHAKTSNSLWCARGAFGRTLILTVLFAIGAASAHPVPAVAAANGDEALMASELPQQTAPVKIDGTVLFRVRGVTAYPAEARARSIEDRIVAVAADTSVSPESLKLVEDQHSTNIMAGDRLLLSVFNADVRIEGGGLSRSVLVAVYRRRIQTAIVDYRTERAPERLLRDALLALGSTLLLAVLSFAIFAGLRRLMTGLERRYQARMQQIEEGSLRMVRAKSIWTVIRFTTRIVGIGVELVLFYLYLHFVLDLFPWTRGLAVNLRSLTLKPVLSLLGQLLSSIPNLIVIALILVATRYLVSFTRFFFSAIRDRRIRLSGFDPDWADSTFKIARVLIIAFALVVCYPYIPGSESPAFKGVTIFLGVLFSLGSSSFLANMIAGYTMTYRRAFHVGDRIKIGDIMGDVSQVRLMVTHLRSIKNEELIVPNSLILNSNVINYSSLARERGLILHTTVGIGYETPWRQVESMLLLAADRTPGLMREPPPFVLQKSLDDYAVTYELNVYCDDPIAMYQLYTELHRSILDVFNEYHVQIMTPSYVADPGEPKVVPRDQWFLAPAEAPAIKRTGSD
jgi:small-conductance mechanosensitive channel